MMALQRGRAAGGRRAGGASRNRRPVRYFSLPPPLGAVYVDISAGAAGQVSSGDRFFDSVPIGGHVMKYSFVIVGSGPSGFYAAEALLQKFDGCGIDIVDKFPAPFGLVRYGVAPDHEKTKNISRSYDRIFTKGDVRFFGNIEVGRDIGLDALCGAYDAVVLATGCPLDRTLGIPGIDLDRVYGAAAFVGWYNSNPDWRHLDPNIDCDSVAIIGNGNVALDVARLLVKTREELSATDMAPHAVDAIANAPIREVYIFGRRGPIEASFTKKELSEMRDLEQCVALARPEQLALELPPIEETDFPPRIYNMKRANLEILKSMTENTASGRSCRVHFEFFAAPIEVLGRDRVRGLKLERTRLDEGRAVGTGETFEVAAGCVISAIGYRGSALEGAPFDERRGIIPNKEGHVEGNLYAVGWAKRGPTGTIPTNRADSFAVVDLIAAALVPTGKEGRDRLLAQLSGARARVVSYEDWQEIKAAEAAAALKPAPRRKFATVEEMLQVLD